MDLESVKSIRGLRVEPAGGEQQRRRRQEQPQPEFSEALEDSLDAEQQPGHHEPGPETRPTTPPVPGATTPLIQDFVSISLQGKVGAEVYNARGATLKISLAQLLALGLHDQVLPSSDRALEEVEEETSPSEPETNGNIDTVA